ncbi:hypothetical protein C8Q74DRAFT_1226993 [Fomes fomentarius]|nr:hypothetical protein C8Q74DRAFT_1226993 [Fomes fomentarius]
MAASWSDRHIRASSPGVSVKLLINRDSIGFYTSLHWFSLVRLLHYAYGTTNDFSSLAIDEESSTVLSADLGTIEVQMWRVDKFVPSVNHYSLGDIPEIGTMHEKSKKAGVHVVSLGAAKTETPRKALRDVGVESEPFAVFLFRYRSLELLQANDIAPLPKRIQNKQKRPTIPSARVTPEAGPSNPKRRRTSGVEDEPQIKAELEGGEEDDDRVTFLEEQIAMLQNRLAEEKAKKGKTPVKREVSPISVPAAWTNEVIDLT